MDVVYDDYFINLKKKIKDFLMKENEKYLFEKIGCIYFEKAGIAEFVNLVNKHNITKEEFFTAYKNVFGGKNAD